MSNVWGCLAGMSLRLPGFRVEDRVYHRTYYGSKEGWVGLNRMQSSCSSTSTTGRAVG